MQLMTMTGVALVLLFGSSIARDAAAATVDVLVLSDEECPWIATLADAMAAVNLSVAWTNTTLLLDDPGDTLASLKATGYLVLTNVTTFAPALAPVYERYARAGGQLALLGGAMPTRWFNQSVFTLNAPIDHCTYTMSQVSRVVDVQTPDSRGLDFTQPLVGVSALAFAGPGQMTYLPRLEARDVYNRTLGWALSSAYFAPNAHFPNATWHLCGMASPEFYTPEFLTSYLVPLLASPRQTSQTTSASTSKTSHALGQVPTSTLPPLAAVCSSSDGHLRFCANATRYFMVGANLYRAFDNRLSSADVESNLRRAHALGLNTLRLFNFADWVTTAPNATDNLLQLRTLCRTYGIRVIFTLDYDPKIFPANASLDQIAARASALGRVLRDEDWILAYDLGNEPYFWELASFRLANNTDQTLHQRYPYDQHGNASIANYLAWLNPGDSSQFQNLHHGLPVPTNFLPAVQDVDNIYRAWANAKAGGLHSAGDQHMITIGYNTLYGLRPWNAALLNFSNHHVYPNGPNYHTLNNFSMAAGVPTTLDRLLANWAALDLNHSVTLGEFGLSEGDDVPCSATQLTGCNITTAESTLYDSLLWLYALATNTDGANRWRMNDIPLPLAAELDSYIGSIQTNYAKYRQESYFGLFLADNTLDGRPKTLAFWLQFFTAYLRARFPHHPTLNMTLHSDEGLLNIAYSAHGAQSTFCGGTGPQTCGPGLQAAPINTLHPEQQALALTIGAFGVGRNMCIEGHLHFAKLYLIDFVAENKKTAFQKCSNMSGEKESVKRWLFAQWRQL
ncbi:uncharacterized protein MONBRDRAFT_32463 [Monosiga brevicollis MX1]|uniref:Glycoside hydrolase family 5 domain-containing protein n=1 Tax=Monosiga brevicollis TaxID=81824 RepID=A9UZN0_MONBE|nr:uncharacterized protein MONBRDRAFT_32463 [Monosiga brevicollis MX1]EDQ89260.1 predicted protein [Monosiga brevicollis MX1]|eukprot:XP_001745836.1 hypothetical protein [Monosiga brevicollis MX1]